MSNKPNLKARPQPQPADRPSKNGLLASPVLWLVGLIVVAGAVAIGISAGSGESVATIETETAFTEAIGDPLPAFAAPDPAVGMTIPTLSVQTLEGDRATLRAEGTARLYGFFAHWCPHCQDELPRAAQWLEENPLPAGVEVIAVSTAVDSTATNFPPSDWFAREDWPATVVLDSAEGTLSNAFGLTSFPFWVAVDGEGTVVQRVAGAMDEAQFAALVASLEGTAG